MKIKSVSIENFKGVSSLGFNLSGNVTKVLGKNATGKTTIADAIAWSLTGKDRNAKTLDNIKPILNGEVKDVPTSVSIDLEDGGNITRTNSKGKTFIMHNGEQTTATKLAAKLIAETGQEEVMNVLYNPQIFFEMPQKKQLKTVSMLLPSKSEIASSISELTGFDEKEVKKLYTTSGKVISADIKNLTSKSEQLKENIKNVSGQISDLPGTHDSAVSKVNEFKKNRELLLKKYGENSVLPELNGQLIELKNKFLSLKDKHNTAVQNATGKLNDEINSLNSSLNDLKIKINSLQNGIIMKQGTANQLKQKVESVKNDFNSKVEYGKAGNFKYCDACGQELPEDQVSGIREKLLSEIHELRSQYDGLVSDLKNNSSEIESDTKEIENLKLEEKELTKSIGLKVSERKENYVPYSEEYVTTNQEIKAKEAEIKSAEVSEKPATSEIDGNISNMQSIISKYESLEEMLGKLNKEYKSLKESITENETLLSKTVKAENAYREVSESSISKLLDEKVDLFKQLKNGGVREDFKVLDDDGIESGQQNNAKQVRLGVKVADKIKDKLGIEWPTVVDNAEAVNGNIDTSHQLIELIVTDDKLTIEE